MAAVFEAFVIELMTEHEKLVDRGVFPWEWRHSESSKRTQIIDLVLR